MTEKPKHRTINQHTVPRCYLKRFASPDLRFYYFDKETQRASDVGTRKATVEVDFYSLHPDTLPQGGDTEFVETTFKEIETHYGQILGRVIDEANVGRITFETGSSLAQLLTLQWLRTVGMRKALLELDEVAQEKMRRWYEKNAPGVKLEIRRCAGYEAGLHANMMMDRDIIMALAEKFWNLYWFVGYNGTSIPFYTSDDPVVRDRIPPANDGPHIPPDIGLEYYFPLSSELVLVMMDRWLFAKQFTEKGIQIEERQTVEFAEADVERCNALQVIKSTKYVFCRDRKFELAERLCKEEPRICSPDRDRELIHRTTLTLGENVSVVIQ